MTSGALLGEGSCLCAASTWALTVAAFRRPIQDFGSRTINLAKCAIASVLFLVTILALGKGGALTAAPFHDVTFVALSGLVGLTAGDSALFAAVHRLGPYRALLLQTLAPVFTALFALAWQREIPSATHLAGMALTLLGVALVVAPRAGTKEKIERSRRTAGIVFGILAAVGRAGESCSRKRAWAVCRRSTRASCGSAPPPSAWSCSVSSTAA